MPHYLALGHICSWETLNSCSLVAFDERVTFWLQCVRSLPCACAYVALFARRLAYNHYAIAHAYNAANAHAQGSDRARWSQKVTLSLKAIGVYLLYLQISVSSSCRSTHPASPDRLLRSHIMQYRCGYCKLGVPLRVQWRYSDTTRSYHACSSCRVPSKELRLVVATAGPITLIGNLRSWSRGIWMCMFLSSLIFWFATLKIISAKWNNDVTNDDIFAGNITQQNSYSISHLLATATTQWLDSDSVVTVDNCRQHGDYTVDQLCSNHAAGS